MPEYWVSDRPFPSNEKVGRGGGCGCPILAATQRLNIAIVYSNILNMIYCSRYAVYVKYGSNEWSIMYCGGGVYAW